MTRRRKLALAGLMVLPSVVLVATFFVYPLVAVVWDSFSMPTFGLQNYREIVEDPVTVKVLVRTFAAAAIVSLACLVIAYPYAYAMTKVSPRVRRMLVLIVLMPFWTSLMARTFAWYVLEQEDGVISRFFGLFGLEVTLLGTVTGVVVAMIQVMLPFMVLPLYSGMATIDTRLVTAAQSLGASRIRAYCGIYLPLSLPAVVSGVTIVFIVSLGFYVTPALLGSPNQSLLSQIIAVKVNVLLDFASAGALGAVLFVLTLIAVLTLSRVSQTRNGLGKVVGND